jgi:uncharacterized phage protein (TIGR02218 family)
MLSLPGSLISRIKGDVKVLHFATCWRVTRTDGVIIRVTDHNCELEVDEELTDVRFIYTPVTGFNTSAREFASGLKERNAEITGAISSDLILPEDLRAGRYRNAEVREMLVDWSHAWAGPYYANEYSIVSLSYDGAIWKADVIGPSAAKLLKPSGRIYNRTCDADLFDGRCKVNRASFTQSGTVTAVANPRRTFTISVSQPDNYFERGELSFTSGGLTGLTFEIAWHVGGQISFYLQTPFNVAIGHAFTIVPGCDQLKETCKNKFSNLVNFRGYPYLIGNDRMIRTPDAK